jgi:transcriptional regulator with XRE-family HTH domain
MVLFDSNYLDAFLTTVRKYMAIRGGYSQKDLAEKVNVGISTMSRFLNQKTKELDPQLIAAIVAKLNIPLHEIIDFVEEDSTALFKKMVTLYIEPDSTDKGSMNEEADAFEETLGKEETRTQTTANIRGVKVSFGERRADDRRNTRTTGEKLADLTARQKGFLSDFLDLDVDGQDLVVSAGEVIIKYLNRKQFEI